MFGLNSDSAGFDLLAERYDMNQEVYDEDGKCTNMPLLIDTWNAVIRYDITTTNDFIYSELGTSNVFVVMEMKKI